MQKHAYLIHGWGGGPHNSFRPWLKLKLEEAGYEATCPLLPDTNHPVVEAWVGALRHAIRNPDEETVLVGHSLGCLTLLLFIQSLPDDARVGKLILVAPVFDAVMRLSDEEKKLFEPWLNAPLDYERIRSKTRSVAVFLDDSDPWIPLQSTQEIAKEKLGAKIIIEHAAAHFSDEEGKVEVPAVLKEILLHA